MRTTEQEAVQAVDSERPAEFPTAQRLLILVPTQFKLPARRRLCAPAGADILIWVQKSARRGDTVLADLTSHGLEMPRVRELAAWGASARDHGITLLIVGRVWHRAALSELTCHAASPDTNRVVWINE